MQKELLGSCPLLFGGFFLKKKIVLSFMQGLSLGKQRCLAFHEMTCSIQALSGKQRIALPRCAASCHLPVLFPGPFAFFLLMKLKEVCVRPLNITIAPPLSQKHLCF